MIKLNPLTGNFDDVGFPARTITGTTNQITVTNGDGVSGNPTLSLPQNIHTGASPTFAGATMTNDVVMTSGKAITFKNTANNATMYLSNIGGSGVNYLGVTNGFGPTADSTYSNGDPLRYWSSTYTDRLCLNSTACIDGGTAGTLAVTGKVSVTGVQSIYVPNQTDFAGSMFLGNGGGSLSYTSGDSGRYNTGVGIDALLSVTTGSYNAAIGRSLRSTTTGQNNMGIGSFALNGNTTGSNNVAVGVYALFSNVSGGNNLGIGQSALFSNKGYWNIAIGTGAGFSNSTGDGNIFIGYQAGYNETGSNKLYIANTNTATPLIKGDFSANTIETPASIEITDTTKGVILTAPDASRWRITVDNSGNLTTTSI